MIVGPCGFIYLMVASMISLLLVSNIVAFCLGSLFPMGKQWGCEIDLDVGSIGCAYLLATVRWPNLLMFTRA